MQVWTNSDHQMLSHIIDVIGDRMRSEDGYSEQDGKTMAKLEAMTSTLAHPDAKVVPADVRREQDCDDAVTMYRNVVWLELKHWVPDASQRLIRRAAVLLDQPRLPEGPDTDHGPNPGDHALFPDWVAGLYVLHCATCHRLFQG